MKTYAFLPYAKPGDDFNDFAMRSKSISIAFRRWSEFLQESAEQCDRLAIAFDGTDVKGEGSGDEVELYSESEQGQNLLAKLAKQLMIDVIDDLDEEFEDDEDDDDDYDEEAEGGDDGDAGDEDEGGSDDDDDDDDDDDYDDDDEEIEGAK